MVNKNARVLVVEDDQMVEQANATNTPYPEMDAIAIGVEAKLDSLSAYSKIVTQRTIEIARQLGISEEEIQKWAAAKAILDSKRDRVIRFESI